MRILFDIGHPAHVHLFRNTANNLVSKGHTVKFTTRDKESTISLLKSYGFDYEIRGDMKPGMIGKALGLLSTDYRMYKIAKKFNPDLFVGVHNPYTAEVAFFMRKKSITFTDTEGVKIAGLLTFPFTNTIITPSCFMEKLDSKKHVKVDGYKELAYIHPNHFTPDPTVPESIGLHTDENYIILRFISWGASHDVGLSGIKSGSELEFIKKLEKYGRVRITSERKLSPELEQYRITCSPDKIHSLLYYAGLYIGEGGTMAAESAMLGTPAIHIESTPTGIATGEYSGNFRELRDKYGLLYFYPTQEQALAKAVEILENPNSKKDWQNKRQKLITDKVDVSAWLTNYIEKYIN